MIYSHKTMKAFSFGSDEDFSALPSLFKMWHKMHHHACEPKFRTGRAGDVGVV
jgi:hypothetical protein